MGAKRSTRWYRKNEAEVMKSLGFKPTINSGSGWIEKEDGQNEHCICQLKSTDARSISVKQDDLHILEYNAAVAHKMPVFAIQFINTQEIWLMVKPEDLEHLKNKSDKQQKQELDLDIEGAEVYTKIVTNNNCAINKNALARKRYEEQKQKEKDEQEKIYKERKKHWKKQ